MSGKPFCERRGWRMGWMASGVLLLTMALSGLARAQAPASAPAPVETPEGSAAVQADYQAEAADGRATGWSGILQAACRGCSGGLLGKSGGHGAAYMAGGGCGEGCGSCCWPGRKPCCPNHEAAGPVGRFFCHLYDCICCPDPCWEPIWIASANNAFFVDSARPITHMRIRWDQGYNMTFPDRNEFFWPRADGNGKFANYPGGRTPPAPFRGETGLKWQDLTVYNEAAVGGFGAFTEFSYKQIDPDLARFTSGFGDMTLGTKSVIMDCELVLLTFQFKTYLPIGNFLKGLGTGHVALEPSFLITLKLAPECYLQTQLSQWIPLGGDNAYEGSLFHYHLALNSLLWCPWEGVQLVGSAELNGYCFQDGLYTDPLLGPRSSSGDSYLSVGPGIRLVLCDKVDFGVAAQVSLTEDNWFDQLYRFEFRWRF